MTSCTLNHVKSQLLKINGFSPELLKAKLNTNSTSSGRFALSWDWDSECDFWERLSIGTVTPYHPSPDVVHFVYLLHKDLSPLLSSSSHPNFRLTSHNSGPIFRLLLFVPSLLIWFQCNRCDREEKEVFRLIFKPLTIALNDYDNILGGGVEYRISTH